MKLIIYQVEDDPTDTDADAPRSPLSRLSIKATRDHECVWEDQVCPYVCLRRSGANFTFLETLVGTLHLLEHTHEPT